MAHADVREVCDRLDQLLTAAAAEAPDAREWDTEIRRTVALGLPAEEARDILLIAFAFADSRDRPDRARSIWEWSHGVGEDGSFVLPVNRHVSAGLLAAGGATSGAWPSLPLLHSHFQPEPLPPQQLVEALKHPFCVGEARRAVLDALGSTYRRTFADQWEFVEYARAHQPHLDLLSPPKRARR
jgi:hypothetical protein